MKLEELIGTKIKAKILQIAESEKYYIAQDLNKQYYICIENTEDYEPEELIGSVEDCLIINVIDDKLLGFILSNRKFENDLRKIDNKLSNFAEYEDVKDIYLMERLKIKGKIVGLYMVDEGEIGKYYLDTIEIGTYIKKIKENNIIFKEKTIEDEIGKQIRDVIQSIDLTKKEISINDEDSKELNLIYKALGIKKGSIKNIAILDLDQEILEHDQQNKKQEIENQKDQIKKTNLNNKIQKQPEFKTTKDINIKQETKMNSRVTDMKNLGQLLEKNKKLPHIKGKKFEKMGVIESDDRNTLIDEKGNKAKRNTTRYSFVAIAKDGTVVPLNLEQDYQEGRNPMERNYQINQKGEVEQDDVSSRYRIGDGTFAIKNGQMGELKIYHSPRKTIGSKGNGIEGNKSLDRELETKNVWRLKKEVLDLASDYKTNYKSVQKSYEEAIGHEDESGNIKKDDKMNTKDVDGDKYTKSHTHDNVDFDELASKWGYYIDGKPNSDRAKELFEEKRKENPNKEEKEIIEMVTDDIEDELHHRRQDR